MDKDVVIFIISYAVIFVGMTIYVYFGLKKPFTLADLLFYPRCEVIKGNLSNAYGIQLTSIVKWMPFVNFVATGVFLAIMFGCAIYFLFSWIYDNIIFKIFSKIKFE